MLSYELKEWGGTLEIFQQKRHPERFTIPRGIQAEAFFLGIAGNRLQRMWDNFQTYLACRQLPEMSTGNYTHIKESSTEEVPLEDCSVGEWIFQGNWRLSTLDLGHVHGDHSTFSASRLYYKNSRWRIGCQEEAILLKCSFPLNNVTPCNKLWSHHYPWKNAFLLTSVLFRLVVRPCWWLFRAILSFFLRRSSVLTFSPRGTQSSTLFSSTGLAFNWVRIQEVSSVTLKTSKPG